MKKLFFISLSVFFFTSCKEKLPAKISMQIRTLDAITDSYNKYIDLVLQLDQEKIDNLPIDSLRKILSMIDFYEERYNKEHDKLSDMLTEADPKFTWYGEVQNVKRLHNHSNDGKNYSLYSKNWWYMSGLDSYYHQLQDDSYGGPTERPKYGFAED